VQLVKKTPMTPGTEFELDTSDYRPADFPAFVSGDCTLGYKLFTEDGPALLFDGQISCERFANLLATSMPRSIKFRFADPGGPLTVVSVQELVQ